MFQTITSLLIEYGPLGVLLLAFIDSAGVPVAVGMDALIIYLAARNPPAAPYYAAIGVFGSAAGNIVLFWLARQGGRRFLSTQAPPARTLRFRDWFQRYGLLTVFVPALVPIPLPLKVFVISAGALRVPLSTFLAVILLARTLRYGGEAYLGAQVGEHSAQYLKDNAWPLLGAAVGLFVVLYTLMRLRDRARGPASDLG
ncbi:MAG: VTT domain-containing protein [Bryobacterales bacterium]|nr:VTT domain-containing protein [Bryobacterales bacterium]